MAKVALRLYNREIERLIDQGGTNEAIAHCRHILKTFPKYLETYRLLGKSYLESHRYNEAVDVFTRVLMAAPDDFVAHVGMSIINDEQNRLDDAIWHMERAFESQPSNAAIQGELQRLYGRRDGMEPPKVRMTRGALAHMYVQGELYPQAIAEIRAVLNQDSQRADMQILLARAFFKSGQKADAADLCTQLLNRYAYCFEADRIMVELLPSSVGAAENTQVYRTRVNELDPYASLARGSVFASNEVADNSVMLERLEYTGDEMAMGSDWNASLGLGASAAPVLIASGEPDQPDWLQGFSSPPPNNLPTVDPFADTGETKAVAAPSDQAQNEIPDFMRAAGWNESSGAPEEPVSSFETREPAGGELTPANIPDWLKDQAPTANQSLAPAFDLSNSGGAGEPLETPDWLNSLGKTQESAPASTNAAGTPDWLAGLGAAQAAQETPVESAGTPDWLSGLGGAQASDAPAEPANEGPPWLKAAVAAQEADSQPAPSSMEVPDWLSTLGQPQADESAQASAVPDWLNAPAAEVPLAIGSMQRDEPSTQRVDDLGATEQGQDAAVAWLESLAAKHGAKPKELVTDPKMRSETPPDWVEHAKSAAQAEVPAAPTAASIDDLGSTAKEQDDAMAWLESLAAKHGAKPEELVTDPNKRSETPPDWVQQAREAAANEPAETSQWSASAQNVGEQILDEFEEKAPAEARDKDATNIWLREQLERERRGQTAELPRAELPRADLPEWMNDGETPASESLPQKGDLPDWLGGMGDDAGQEFGVQNMSRGDLSDWLSGLDEMPASDVPAGESTSKDMPDWLKADDEEPQASEKMESDAAPVPNDAVPAAMEGDLPSWLQGMEAQTAKDEAGDDDASWITKETWESGAEPQLKPTVASDWKPAEPKEATPRKADFSSRPPMPAPKPSVAPPSNEPVYEPIEKALAWTDEPPAKETRMPAAPPPMTRPVAQPASQGQVPVPAKPVVQKPPAVKKAVRAETVPTTSALNQAKDELDRGDIPAALEHYAKLIKKGKHIEETIRDLSESIYRYPVEVSIWQTLGDAYMRANRLKEALEAYNKAEELIR